MQRFEVRELTIQEMIWMDQCARKEDMEACIYLMESLRVDKTWHIRSMLESELETLMTEMCEAIRAGRAGAQMFKALEKTEKMAVRFPSVK